MTDYEPSKFVRKGERVYSKHEGWPAIDTNEPWHYSFEGIQCRSSLRKRQRQVIVAIAALALWFILWGTMGYFFGIRGVGFGWPAFWGVGGISLLVPVIIAVLAGLIGLSSYWIQKGEK